MFIGGDLGVTAPAGTAPASATPHDPPAEFGTDWRDPVTAARAADVPGRGDPAHRPLPGDRLRTVLTLGDRADSPVPRAGQRPRWTRLDDTYAGGCATWTTGVPRDQRHAVGTSSERYRLYGSGGCRGRSPGTEQGTLTEDRRHR